MLDEEDVLCAICGCFYDYAQSGCPHCSVKFSEALVRIDNLEKKIEKLEKIVKSIVPTVNTLRKYK